MGRLRCVQEMSAVTAACMMVKTSVFKAVGGFDEELKVAFNDIDLCMKVRKYGVKLYSHRMQNCIIMNPNPEEWKIHRRNSCVFQRSKLFPEKMGKRAPERRSLL